MHPYIPHLLQDIASAHRVPEEIKETPPKSFEEEMEEVERFIREEPPNTLSYFCGLLPEHFPPPDQLSEEDMEKVFQAFKKMLWSWKLTIDLPDNIPIPFAYKLMVETLDKKTWIPDSGFAGFDYCTGYAPDCELKEYCPCLEKWKELENDPNNEMSNSDTNDEIPF